MTDTTIIAVGELQDICSRALSHVGVPGEDADIVARLLVRSEAEGAASHGILRLPMLLRRLREGSVSRTAPMAVVHETSTTAMLDAQDGIGQVAGIRGMELAVAKAAAHGLGAVTVINSGNFGRAGHPALIAAEHDMIGIVASNSSPRVVPAPNMKPVLGNNPWAVAIPTQSEPIVVDMANSVVANGKIRAAKLEGRPIPEGWATDAEGRATTDAGAALKGALLTFGGYKGWALSLIVDLLTGVLGDGAYGDKVGPPDDLKRPQRSCFFLLALNLQHFGSPEAFRARSQDLIGQIRDAADGPVRIPGEKSAASYAAALRDGVKLKGAALAELDAVFAEIGFRR